MAKNSKSKGKAIPPKNDRGGLNVGSDLLAELDAEWDVSVSPVEKVNRSLIARTLLREALAARRSNRATAARTEGVPAQKVAG